MVPRALGPRVGGQVQQVIKAVKAGDWSLVDGAPVAAGVTLQEGEYELKLVAADAEHSAPLPGGEGVVVLDTAVTPELAAEGLARDVIRVVQQARRDADLDVSDRIALRASTASPTVVGGGRGAPGLRGRPRRWPTSVALRRDGRPASPARSATASRSRSRWPASCDACLCGPDICRRTVNVRAAAPRSTGTSRAASDNLTSPPTFCTSPSGGTRCRCSTRSASSLSVRR